MRKTLIFLILTIGLFLVIKPVHAGTIIKPVFNTGLIGYWNFQEGAGSYAYDKSGYDNDGDLTNMEESDWVDGRIGKALKMNVGTSNEYVDYGNPAELQLENTGTIATWLKYSTQSDHAGVISKNDWTADRNGYNLGIHSGDQKISGQIADGSGYDYVKTTQALNDDTWHHVIFTWDGNYLRIYVDGLSDATPVSQTLTPVSNIYNLQIGKIAAVGYASYYYDGDIDEVRIYNRALSASEIQRIYKLSQPKVLAKTRTGLVGYWSFDEGTGTNVGDMSGNGNNGTLEASMTEDDWVDGKLGKALEFDGSDDYISVGTNTLLDTKSNLTFGAWVKYNSLTGHNPILIKGDSNNWQYGVFPNGTTQYCKIYQDNSGADYLESTTNVSLNEWIHIMCVLTNDSKIEIYKNGVLAGTDITTSGTKDTSSGTNFYIGMFDSSPDELMNGKIDEVRVYDRALDASEIEAIYKSGLAKVSNSQNDQLTDGLVGLWSFNGPDMDRNEAYDRSGQGNTGTLSGPPTRTIGKVGQALDFDGSNDFVNVTDSSSIEPTTAITIAAWFRGDDLLKHQGDNTKGQTIVRKPGNYVLYFYDEGAGSPGVDLDLWLTGVTPDRLGYSVSGNLDNNVWYHVTATYDGSAMKIYLDGEQVAQQGASGNIGVSVNDLGIGYGPDYPGDGLFDGLIDEVRIYNRALNAEEVRRLYNMGR